MLKALTCTIGRYKCDLTVSFLCVCPLIDDKLRHNIVKVAAEPRAAGDWFRSNTDALKIEVNLFFTITGTQNSQMHGINEGIDTINLP